MLHEKVVNETAPKRSKRDIMRSQRSEYKISVDFDANRWFTGLFYKISNKLFLMCSFLERVQLRYSWHVAVFVQ